MNEQNRRVALVTGGSRGIGLGVAKCLAAAEFDVVINGRRAADDVAEALAELESLGAATLYCQADIGNLEDHARMLSEIRDRLGRLDVLVNNAGVAPDVRSDLLEATPDSFDRLITINLRGPYFLTQAAAKWMIEQRQADAEFQAAIINVSSVSATEASINRGDYCISKAGVAMATQLWAARLGEYGIPVFEIRPGVIRTDMTAGVTDKYDKMLAEGLTVEPRWGVPEDIGRAVTVLATGQLTYATGAVLPVDGGMTVRRL
ncbi:3-ketoacyl-ACP reductase [Aeoliella sp.]|uniref:3-ketoacyl-ACP reductase n=1 Tax=Aeoliella sp. TaxID=2795800 RepID=UPI003CCBDFE5